MVLVLDDYQFISSTAVHQGMDFLIEHCPGTCTCSSPPAPTRLSPCPACAPGARWSSCAPPTCALQPAKQNNFEPGHGLSIDERSVALLEERTEGWVAGLQMLRCRCASTKTPPGLSRILWTNRHILDYLMEEVLAGQSLRSSVFYCTLPF